LGQSCLADHLNEVVMVGFYCWHAYSGESGPVIPV
jgi:hypothetical protein